MKPLEVVFCGNSVYLCGLAAGLQQNEQLRIRMVDMLLDKAMPELKMLCPDVVISECPDSELVNALVRDNPHLFSIGIDAASDSLTVLAGGRPLLLSVEELARVILQYTDTNI